MTSLNPQREVYLLSNDRNKDATNGAKGIATRSDRTLLGAPGLTTRSKKLLGARALLLGAFLLLGVIGRDQGLGCLDRRLQDAPGRH